MAVCTEITMFMGLCYVLSSFHLSVALNNDAYQVLSTKIQSVNLEVNYLRNTLISVKSSVANLEELLKQGNNVAPSTTNFTELGKHEDDEKKYFDVNNETEQYFNIMKQAWKSEKTRTRNVEKRMNQVLIDTKTTLDEADTNIRNDLDAVKDTMNEIRNEMKIFSKRLDEFVENRQSDLAKWNMIETELTSYKASVVSLSKDFDVTKTELASVKDNLNERMETLGNQLAGQEVCQSGNGVGVHTYPSRSFPYTVTVRFNPPFKKTPAFVYGTVLLDATDHTRYNANLQSLTRESFTIQMSTWATYYLWGARVSWMACPT